MIALNVDYTKNEITIDFTKVKANTIENLNNYYRDIISDLSIELSKETNSNFDLELVDNITHTLKSATNELTELVDGIGECTSITEIINVLYNSNFEEDDAMIFFLMFDTPVTIQNS